MNWFTTLITTVVGGLLGLLCAGLILAFCTEWYRITGSNGAYFVAIYAVVGGIISLLVSFVIACLMASAPAASFPRGLAVTCGTVLGLAAVVAIVAYTFGEVPPRRGGRRLNVEAEFRLPAGGTLPPDGWKGGAWMELAVTGNVFPVKSGYGSLQSGDARRDGDRWLIPATVGLFTTRPKRVVKVQLGERDFAEFPLPAPGRPGREFETWSAWLPADAPATQVTWRFRIVPQPLPTPPPTDEEFKAATAAGHEKAFAAVAPDAPAAAWLPFTRPGIPDAIQANALGRLMAGPDRVAEIARLMVGDDAETANEVMHLVPRFLAADPRPEFRTAMAAAVAAAGRDLATRLRAVNAIPAATDPSFDAASDVARRFYGWISATEKLHTPGSDEFIPELRAILELSRVRTDIYIVQADVRRICSFYAQEWAGIAPLPGDPKPK